MRILKYLLLLFVLIVSTTAYRGEVVGAPVIDMGMIRNLELDNGDIPVLINLISKEYGIDEKLLTQTLTCESGLRQFDENGKVLKSHTGDSGVGQINLKTGQKTADRLGYDLNKPVDNLLMTAGIINNDSRGFENGVCYK